MGFTVVERKYDLSEATVTMVQTVLNRLQFHRPFPDELTQEEDVMRHSIAVSFLALVMAASSLAFAQEPRELSKIEVVRTSGSTTGCNSNDNVALDTIAFDGTPFKIPDRSVFLVTDISFDVAPSANLIGVYLNDSQPTFGQIGIIPTISTAGAQAGVLHFTTPVVIKHNQTLCIGETPRPATLNGYMVGFFAKDYERHSAH